VSELKRWIGYDDLEPAADNACGSRPVPWRQEGLANLPEGPGGADPFWRLAAAFLVAYPDSTAKAYLGDLKAWAGWCAERGVLAPTATTPVFRSDDRRVGGSKVDLRRRRTTSRGDSGGPMLRPRK